MPDLTRRSELGRGDLFDRFFDTPGYGRLSPWTSFGEELSTRWVPAVDVSENDDHFTVRAELPGMKKEDIDITLEGNVLTLGGERRMEKETRGEELHRSERRYGRFSRSFSLPTKVDREKVEARFAEGILELKLPKAEESKARRIAIR